jgi:hypothetical protein
MADMEISIRFWWKASHHATIVLTLLQVMVDYLPNKIPGGSAFWSLLVVRGVRIRHAIKEGGR